MKNGKLGSADPRVLPPQKKIARRSVRDDALLEPEWPLFALGILNPHPAFRRAHRGVPCLRSTLVLVAPISMLRRSCYDQGSGRPTVRGRSLSARGGLFRCAFRSENNIYNINLVLCVCKREFQFRVISVSETVTDAACVTNATTKE